MVRRPLIFYLFFFLMIRRPPRSTLDRSSAASDVYKRQALAIMRLVRQGKLSLDADLSKIAPEIAFTNKWEKTNPCLLYTSPSPRDRTRSRMPSSA